MTMLSNSAASRIIGRLFVPHHRRPKEPMVMRDSHEAAQYMTGIKGWVSRDGHYYGDNESAARYAGCTHIPCSGCSQPVEKPWTKCQGCRDVDQLARWEAMPRKAWDGVAMVYSQLRDEYFNSPEDAADTLEEGETLDVLQLVICEPNRARPIGEDHFADDLPEDGDLPSELDEALAKLNEVILTLPPLSWSPGKFALEA